MKKKIIISIVIIIIIYIIYYVISINNISNSVINNLNKEINDYNNYIDSLNIKNEGKLDVDCKYKGAHGQFFPATYNYDFQFSDNTLTLSNDKGYGSRKVNFNIVKLDKLSIKSKKYSFNKIIINTNKYTIKVKTNILGRVSSINISNKDININTDSKYKRYQGSINNKSFIFDKSNSSKYINYNNLVKANILNNKINLVIGDYSFNLVFNKNGSLISFNSPSSIYMGIDTRVVYGKASINKSNELGDDDIPIFRYINNMEVRDEEKSSSNS